MQQYAPSTMFRQRKQQPQQSTTGRDDEIETTLNNADKRKASTVKHELLTEFIETVHEFLDSNNKLLDDDLYLEYINAIQYELRRLNKEKGGMEKGSMEGKSCKPQPINVFWMRSINTSTFIQCLKDRLVSPRTNANNLEKSNKQCSIPTSCRKGCNFGQSASWSLLHLLFYQQEVR